MCDVDVGVCNPSGCYGGCPTSTRCSRIRYKRSSSCPHGGWRQRPGCGCSCRCPAPEKCPNGVRVKDYINVISDDLIVFRSYYKLLRSSPRLPNKPSQMPKGPDGKPIMKGKKGKGKDGKGGSGSGGGGGSGSGGGNGRNRGADLFSDYDDSYDNGYDNGEGGADGTDGADGGGGGGGSRGGRNRKKPSKEQRLKNKLNTLFDEALKTGLLFEVGKKKKKKDKTRTPEYYKDVLGIAVSCLQTCEPECCDE